MVKISTKKESKKEKSKMKRKIINFGERRRSNRLLCMTHNSNAENNEKEPILIEDDDTETSVENDSERTISEYQESIGRESTDFAENTKSKGDEEYFEDSIGEESIEEDNEDTDIEESTKKDDEEEENEDSEPNILEMRSKHKQDVSRTSQKGDEEYIEDSIGEESLEEDNEDEEDNNADIEESIKKDDEGEKNESSEPEMRIKHKQDVYPTSQKGDEEKESEEYIEDSIEESIEEDDEDEEEKNGDSEESIEKDDEEEDINEDISPISQKTDEDDETEEDGQEDDDILKIDMRCKLKEDVLASQKIPQLIIEERHWKISSINWGFRLSIISDILKSVNTEERDIIKRSQVGRFLDFQITEVPQQILLHLIRRQCKSEIEDELWFRFDGKIAKFGMKEFAIVTGLLCHEYPTEIHERLSCGDLGRNIFKNKTTILRNDVRKTFEKSKQLRGPLKIKLAKLYILECIILGKQFSNKINIRDMKLLENDRQFENFPWGRTSYELTIASFRKSLDKHTSDIVALDGFPLAILIWAFEVFPDLSSPENIFAFEMKDTKKIPRMIKWKINNTRADRDSLERRVFGKTDVKLIAMKVTQEEEKEKYIQYFNMRNKRSMEKSVNNNNLLLVKNGFNTLTEKCDRLKEDLADLKRMSEESKMIVDTMIEQVTEEYKRKNLEKSGEECAKSFERLNEFDCYEGGKFSDNEIMDFHMEENGKENQSKMKVAMECGRKDEEMNSKNVFDNLSDLVQGIVNQALISEKVTMDCGNKDEEMNSKNVFDNPSDMVQGIVNQALISKKEQMLEVVAKETTTQMSTIENKEKRKITRTYVRKKGTKETIFPIKSKRDIKRSRLCCSPFTTKFGSDSKKEDDDQHKKKTRKRKNN